MEDVVSEKLEHVPISILRPSVLPIQLCPVYNGTDLGQEPEETRGFDLLGQLVLDGVVPHVRGIQLGVETGTCFAEKKKKEKICQECFFFYKFPRWTHRSSA